MMDEDENDNDNDESERDGDDGIFFQSLQSVCCVVLGQIFLGADNKTPPMLCPCYLCHIFSNHIIISFFFLLLCYPPVRARSGTNEWLSMRLFALWSANQSSFLSFFLSCDWLMRMFIIFLASHALAQQQQRYYSTLVVRIHI